MSAFKDTTNEKVYNSYPINNGVKKNFTCYKKTLDQVINQVEYTISNHSKALFIRLDIRNEKDSDNRIMRNDMTRIIENTKRAIESKYKDSPNKLDMNITWTTENDGDSPHFHCFIGVNGNAIQNGYSILNAMNHAVQKYLKTDNNGLVEFCESNGKYGKMVDRNSPDFIKQMEKAVYAGSYLAKTHTKENKPKGARVSSTSRLPNGWKDSSAYQELMARRNAAKIEECNNDSNMEPESGVFQYEDEFSIMAPPPSLSFDRENDDKHFIEGPELMPPDLREKLEDLKRVKNNHNDIR